MRKYGWLAATMSLSLLAGCGTNPSSPNAKSTGYNGPLAAQEAPSSPAPVTVPGGPGTMPSGAPSAMPSGAPSGMPSGAPSAMPSGAPGGPGGPGGPTTGGPGGPGGAVPPVAPNIGVGIGPGIGGPINVPGPAAGPGTAPFLFGAGDLIAFQSNRATGGGGGFDIFVYDAAAQTVLALPGVNTPANETNPCLSANGEWLVYETDENGPENIYLFNLANQLINTLPTLNIGCGDKMEPAVSDNGQLIVYVTDQVGFAGDDLKHFKLANRAWAGTQLRLFDLTTASNFIMPVANAGLTDFTWPTISGNGAVIAYGADAGLDCNQNIFVYSLATAAQLTPPFVNWPGFDSYNPDLNEDGTRILFVSNRRGSQDIYETDLTSGFTDNLVLANSPAIEDEPRYLGVLGDRFVFQSNRSGNYRLYAYDRVTGLLDTLPVANDPIANTLLRNIFPKIGVAAPAHVIIHGTGVENGPEYAGSGNVTIGGVPDEDP